MARARRVKKAVCGWQQDGEVLCPRWCCERKCHHTKKHFVNSTAIQENIHNLSKCPSVDPPPELPKLTKHTSSSAVQRCRAPKQHPYTLLQRNTHRAHRGAIPDMRAWFRQWRACQWRLNQIPFIHRRLPRSFRQLLPLR